MGSAILLAKRYWSIPVFEHYISPRFNESKLHLDSFHGFRGGREDQLLFALRGNVSNNKIYGVIDSAISDIKKDNTLNDTRWSLSAHHAPQWRMQYPMMVDSAPEVIGRYDGESVASELFSSVALGYIARASEEAVDDLVENARRSLSSLGKSLSDL